MTSKEFFLKALRKVYRHTIEHKPWGGQDKGQGRQYYKYVELFNQDANDYVRELLATGKPCMISKFGSIELGALVNVYLFQHRRHKLEDILDFIRCDLPTIDWFENGTVSALCNNAGFFPNDKTLMPRYYDINYSAMKEIDVLGSYMKSESIFKEELAKAKKVNLDGYYAPYYYKNPWTMELAGKKVLVVHPFAEDIASQYNNHRTEIWEDSNVLPVFELITYKSVQSMLGIKTPYANWFEALDKMKEDISKLDFDIALIGCGAYGMPLAAYVKNMGKQAVHLAGWTQVLFGIIGTRWLNNPKVSSMMNQYWIHPSKNNIPAEAKRIENGAYW